MPEHHTLGWNPERTWVFVVGTLEWRHTALFSAFPQQQRRDAALVEFFRVQGVPAAQIVYLQDAQATTRRIQQAFEGHLARAGAGDLLVLYYCGHGGKTAAAATYFASYDTDCEHNQGWLVGLDPHDDRAVSAARAPCSWPTAATLAAWPRRALGSLARARMPA